MIKMAILNNIYRINIKIFALTFLLLATPMVNAFTPYQKVQDAQTVIIGDIAATDSELPRIQAISDIAISDINDYMAKNNLPWRFEANITSAEGSMNTHLAKIKALKASGINLIIGGRWSSFVSNSIAYINSNGVLLISPVLTTQTFNVNDNFFRTCPTDPRQATALAYMMVEQGIWNAIVIQRDDDWGNTLYDALKSEFETRTGATPMQIKYSVSTTDFTSQLQAAEGSAPSMGYQHPIAIVLLGYDEVASILNQAKGYQTINNLMWFGTDNSANQQSIITQAPDQAKKLHLISPAPAIYPSDLYDAVKTRYSSRMGTDLTYYDATEYDAYWLYALSVVAAGDSTAEHVNPKLLETSANYIGISGWCKMDFYGDRVNTDYNFFDYEDVKGIAKSVYNGYYNQFTDVLFWEGTNKIKTAITATASYKSAVLGTPITVTGSITPAVDKAAIRVFFLNYDGTYFVAGANAKPDGTYNTTQVALKKTGTWIVQAWWKRGVPGNQLLNYTLCSSKVLEVVVAPAPPKTNTTTTISIVNNTVKINNPVKITASLDPKVATAKLTFIVTKPDGTVQTNEVYPDDTGAYIYQFNPSDAGAWKVKASWAGDSAHNGFTSVELFFIVTQPPPPKSNLKITIKDANSAPVAGATVISTKTPSSQNALSGTTGADGSVTFSDIKSGTYNITVSKTDYKIKSDTANLELGITTEKLIILEKTSSGTGSGIPNAPLEAIGFGLVIGVLVYSFTKKQLKPRLS